MYCSISGFGQTGPYRGKSAYDQIMQGMGGIMSITGEADRPPVKMGLALTDIGGGMMAAYGIMVALFHRVSGQSEEGQYLDVSMLDLQVAWLTYMGGYYFATGENPQKVGAAHPQPGALPGVHVPGRQVYQRGRRLGTPSGRGSAWP